MNELMVHVERIVRPVAAFAGRKLRMREELLAHLEAAVLEEGGEESEGAVERAKRRLGEVRELTRELQGTVPWVERMLMGRLPVGCGMEGVERRLSRMPGMGGNMTMGHKLTVIGVAALGYLPALVTVMEVVKRVGSQSGEGVNLAMAFAGTMLGVWAQMWVCSWFVFGAAASEANWGRIAQRAAAVLGMEMGLAGAVVWAAEGRILSGWEAGVCAGVTAAFLVVGSAVARRVGEMRRKYDGWLEIELA